MLKMLCLIKKKPTKKLAKKQVSLKCPRSTLLYSWSFQHLNVFWLTASYLPNISNIYNTLSFYLWQVHLSFFPFIPICFYVLFSSVMLFSWHEPVKMSESSRNKNYNLFSLQSSLPIFITHFSSSSPLIPS